MNWQPAFAISAPMQTDHMHPWPEWMQRFQFGAGLPNFGGGGLPTFFPIGNRSALSAADPFGGKPNGIRMLVVPPMRYNYNQRSRVTVADIRKRMSQTQLTRAGTKAVSVGS